jgi:hypothetical protein
MPGIRRTALALQMEPSDLDASAQNSISWSMSESKKPSNFFKDMLKFKELEHVLIEKVEQLF